jgi:hypothetical protein
MDPKQPFIVPLAFTSDVTQRAFLSASKEFFTTAQFLCPMKAAAELAARARPPLVPLPQSDPFGIPGKYATRVITNWFVNQLRKPGPKTPTKRQPAGKRGPKSPAAISGSASSISELQMPYIIFLADYPRTPEILSDMILSQSPVVCHITVDNSAQPPPTEGRKGQSGVFQNAATEWRDRVPCEMPWLTFDIAAEPIESQWPKLLERVQLLCRAYCEYRRTIADARHIAIPSFPTRPLPMPQIAVDRTKAKTFPPPLPPMQTAALNVAYERMLLELVESALGPPDVHAFSDRFQHCAELLPRYPLSRHLADVLSVIPEFHGAETFAMRNIAQRCATPYEAILCHMSHHRFEELIGQKFAERRHLEHIPLEVLANVMGGLSSEYSQFKWTQFGGQLLLAFFHAMPQELPIEKYNETFALPAYCGFNRWCSEHENGTFPDEYAGLPLDVGTNVGRFDLFMGLDQPKSVSSLTKYFSESGLVVVSYPAVVANGVLSNLSFAVTDSLYHRFAFALSQRASSQSGDNEEEEPVETSARIRGMLGHSLEFVFEVDTGSNTFAIVIGSCTVTFDVLKSHVLISGAPEESHRILTRDGKLIRFAPHPIIYSPDGSVGTYSKKVWRLVDAAGRAFVKRDGSWFCEPELNATSENFSTFFTSRKVVKHSNNVSFVEDGDKSEIVFPDGTRYDRKTRTYSHPCLPSAAIVGDSFHVNSKEVTADFAPDQMCKLALRDGSCSINYTERISNLVIQFDSSNEMTTIDLLTGVVATIGARRCVYYLAEDWNWRIGRQLCSKKEILQHFQNGAFTDRLQPVTEMDQSEIHQIMTNGHPPRLFVVEKQFGQFGVHELIDDKTWKNILAKARKDSPRSCLWFDTEPPSFREFGSVKVVSSEKAGQMTAEQIEKQARTIVEAYQNEGQSVEDRNRLRREVLDPKWVDIEEKHRAEEEKMIELYKEFGVDDLVKKLKLDKFTQ